MIYDMTNKTLHSLPVVIRGITIGTPASADAAFLAKRNLRWATTAEVKAYNAAIQATADEAKAAHTALVDGLREQAAVICLNAGIGLPTSFDDARDRLEALTDKDVARDAGLRLITLRLKMSDLGVNWTELL